MNGGFYGCTAPTPHAYRTRHSRPHPCKNNFPAITTWDLRLAARIREVGFAALCAALRGLMPFAQGLVTVVFRDRKTN